MKFEAELTIARPAHEVWAYAADIARHPDWMNVTDAIVTSGDGSQVGARGWEGMSFGPFHFKVGFEVTEAEPGRRIRWQTTGGAPFDGNLVLDLAPEGPSATRATYRSTLVLRGLWRLAAPLIKMEGRAGLPRELRRLKTQVENLPARSTATS